MPDLVSVASEKPEAWPAGGFRTDTRKRGGKSTNQLKVQRCTVLRQAGGRLSRKNAEAILIEFAGSMLSTLWALGNVCRLPKCHLFSPLPVSTFLSANHVSCTPGSPRHRAQSRSFSSPLRMVNRAHTMRSLLSRGARNICAPVACSHERGCRLLAHARHLLTQATTTARAGSSSALPSQIWRSTTTLGAREQQVCLPVRVPRGHREGVTVACAHVMCCVANVAAHTSPHLLRNSHALLCSLTSAATP